MELRSQAAIFLAGCILSCLLQLVPAQENLTVVSIPENPVEGHSILLNVKNIREGFQQCEWTQPSGRKIVFDNSQITPALSPQILEVHRNCSLSIKKMNSADVGKYTIKATYSPAKQQEAKGPEILIGSIYLAFCDGKQIRINVNPSNPHVGQNVILTPNGIPRNYAFCQWKQKTQSGVEKEFQESREESKDQQNQKQVVKQGCSLHLTQLTQADSGSYSIYVVVPSDQDAKQKEKGIQPKECYISQVQLKVEHSGSASVKYSAGIIAGALLGSLAWTGSLSLVPLLFGMLSPSFPKC